MELVTRLLILSPRARVDAAVDLDPGLASVLDRLARRKPAIILRSAGEASARLQQALVDRTGALQRHESDLDRLHSDSEAAYDARVRSAFDRFAREFQEREVVVILPAGGIRAAISCALGLANAMAISVEPCQPIALDWPHPEAREFRHALIGIAFDWDIGPAANKVHKVPGGASVTQHAPR